MAEYIVYLTAMEEFYGKDFAGYVDYLNRTMVQFMGNPLKESIVRCRDCRFRKKFGFCEAMHRSVEPDGFCKWGEREER